MGLRGYSVVGLMVVALGGLAGVAAQRSVGGSAPADGGRQFVRPAEPRIRPLEPSDWTDAQRQIADPRGRGATPSNLIKVCLRNVDLCGKWMPFTSYVESPASSLPTREREMLILRTAWLCHDDYAWTPHARSAARAGLSEEEITRITMGPDAKGWSAFDAMLLRAADELHRDQFISEGTWKALAQRYDERQLLDTVFTVGQYTLVSMFLNSAAVSLPPGETGLPK